MGFGAWEFEDSDLEFRAWEFEDSDLGFRAWGLGFLFSGVGVYLGHLKTKTSINRPIDPGSTFRLLLWC